MNPPIFDTVNVPAVQAFLGTNPLRFFLFGQAPQGVQYPYAVWRQVFGLPENYMDEVPDSDSFTTQIDVYVASSAVSGATKARQIARALRDAVEPVAHVTGWIGDSRDPETKSYVYTFQVEWQTPR